MNAEEALRRIAAIVDEWRAPEPTPEPEPWKMSPVGINFFDGAMAPNHPNYKMPLEPAMWAWWARRGVNVARVAFKWDRAQPTLMGSLDAAHTNDMIEVLRMAADHDMRVVFNMHNYGFREDRKLIGSPGLPDEAFANVWSQLAYAFGGDYALAGYGLMNEPAADMPNWPKTVQVAVDAIREVDPSTPIMIGGVGAGHAWEWSHRNGNLSAVTGDNLVYEAHQYSDQDSSGRFDSAFEDRVQDGWIQEHGAQDTFHAMLLDNFLSWLGDNRQGIIGETGIPSGSMWFDGECDGKWQPHWDYRDGWTINLRNAILLAKSKGVPVFLWTDGIHAEENKLYVGHHAPGGGGPVAEMLAEVIKGGG